MVIGTKFGYCMGIARKSRKNRDSKAPRNKNIPKNTNKKVIKTISDEQI